MTQIEVGYDPVKGVLDPYNRCCADAADIDTSSGTEAQDDDDHLHHYNQNRSIPTPFVDLPLGATEDRVLGSIDFSPHSKTVANPSFHLDY
eukprot:scaffold26631_cov139-Skeletonema_menzelii.AAC.14